jgi:hypothetical protein
MNVKGKVSVVIYRFAFYFEIIMDGERNLEEA